MKKFRSGKATRISKAADSYLNIRSCLWSGTELPAGVHKFKFEFRLPEKCPASGSFGRHQWYAPQSTFLSFIAHAIIFYLVDADVEYILKAELECAWYHSNIENKVY